MLEMFSQEGKQEKDGFDEGGVGCVPNPWSEKK